MRKNNLIRFAQSLVLVPAMTASLTIPGISNLGIASSVLAKQVNIEADSVLAFNQADSPEAVQKEKVLQAEADAIDAYFDKYNMPLKGTGITFAVEADRNGLDWRLLPAITVRESTGGKNACSSVANNPFGWDSCQTGFDSIQDAIAIVANNLGGNNPSTARHYNGKTTKEILQAYNPPSIIPRYSEQVMWIMDSIGPMKIVPATASVDAVNNSTS